MFSDLLHTTDSLKKSKLDGRSNVNRETDSTQLLEDAVGPYKSDNARLVKENNQLHIDFVHAKEDLEAKLRSGFVLLNHCFSLLFCLMQA